MYSREFIAKKGFGMSKNHPDQELVESRMHAEFDSLADEYRNMHETNVAVTGETPEYFSEYKIADLARVLKQKGLTRGSVLDFGSGIGNSVPFFRKHMADSRITCADVSSRSIEIAQTRFPGDEKYIQIEKAIPLQSDSQDVVFTACVFHHIPPDEHVHWLTELRRVTKPGGILAIYEHNPLNPLTVHAVNTCPLDVNAKLIRGAVMRRLAASAGWVDARVGYKLFFPSVLAKLRPLELYLEGVPLGAQYRMLARKGK
jgi:SAM-dependent methyltransferase